MGVLPVLPWRGSNFPNRVDAVPITFGNSCLNRPCFHRPRYGRVRNLTATPSNHVADPVWEGSAGHSQRIVQIAKFQVGVRIDQAGQNRHIAEIDVGATGRSFSAFEDSSVAEGQPRIFPARLIDRKTPSCTDRCRGVRLRGVGHAFASVSQAQSRLSSRAN